MSLQAAKDQHAYEFVPMQYRRKKNMLSTIKQLKLHLHFKLVSTWNLAVVFGFC